ncbi:mitochondrial protein C2orf69 homolog [Oppia nitens]|uniref:mitochondrial protein C2orf69 homolog n=1 Tax=Oppia nitens TaxID=1686743 RepID=UPI0023DA92CD|nr:mitochondrial protein C2orf69 homolog [Oppia nitens]
MVKRLLLRSVEGIANRFNDIIYKSPKDVTYNTHNRHIVCYFGGDIQDLKDNMCDNNEENVGFVDFCLENVTDLLADRFTSSHVFVIRANRFGSKTYAIYDNFVDSNSFGCPKHCFTKESLIHFRLLLLNCFNQLNLDFRLEKDNKLTIIGFSKGCVVLNQFLYSFCLSLEDINLKDMISTISDMYWLDGGHSGSANTWITAEPVLKNLAELQIQVHINVTPYQVMCPLRTWVAKEENLFFNTLTRFGGKVQRVLHFADEDKSLKMHFNVLKHFI